MSITDNIAYSAARHMEMNRHNIQITSNNLANQDTAGFQADRLISTQDDQNSGFLSALGFKTKASTNNFRDLTAGEFQPSDSPLDIALGTADVYFSVQSSGGEPLYTRNGRLHLDENRQLIHMASGFPLTDANNSPIAIPTGAKSITITNDGTVAADGKIISKIGVFSFSNSQNLIKVGDTLLKGTGANPAEKYQVLQGGVEASNVSPVMSLAQLIDLQRQDAQDAYLIKTYREQSGEQIDSLLTPLNV